MTTTSLDRPQANAPQRRVAKRKSKRSTIRLQDALITVALLVILLVLMQVAVDRGWVSNLILATPTSIWSSLVNGITSGSYGNASEVTLIATVLGFLLAAAFGIILAGLMTVIPRIERVTLPLVVGFQSLPKIALAPLVLIWIGFGTNAQVLVVAMVAFFPILINSLNGLRLQSREQYELSQSLGASRWQLFRYVRIPDAMPFIFAGLRVAAIFALLGAVAAEFVGAEAGLGVLLLQLRGSLNVPGTYAVLLVLMVFGVVLNGIMTLAENKIVFWAKDVTATSL
jgi:NitT/TauT family transport system permease protein